MIHINLYNHVFEVADLNVGQTGIKIQTNPAKPLNKFGHGPFCKFSVPKELQCHIGDKGLYFFAVNGIVKYIGSTTQDFKTRIDNGYGNITPGNCYTSGQLTNCHVNSMINNAICNNNYVQLGICPFSDSDYPTPDDCNNAIRTAEAGLIKLFFENVCWNLTL